MPQAIFRGWWHNIGMKRTLTVPTRASSAALASLLALAPLFSAAPAAAQVELGRVAPAVVAPAVSAASAIGGALNAPALNAGSSLSAAPAASLSAAPALSAAAAPAPSAPAASAFTPAAVAEAVSPFAAAETIAPAAAEISAVAAPAADGRSAKSKAAQSAAATPAGAAKAGAPKRRSAAEKRALAMLEEIARSGQFEGLVPQAAPAVGKLGRNKSFADPRNLQLQKYIKADLPAAPATADFSGPVKNWGMMLNDKIGDCTVAACGHQIQQWTANAGTQKTIPDATIQKVYSAVSGYRPGQPDTDQGADPLTVLKYWRKNGIGGDKIGAFAQIDYTNPDSVRQAVWLFGSAYLAIALPISAQKQTVWDVPAGGPVGNGKPGSWGGHAVEIAGFTDQGVVVVTWGQLKLMTWDFLKTYGEEGFAIISEDFLKNGKTPNNGLDIAALKADLKAVTSQASKKKPTKRKPARP